MFLHALPRPSAAEPKTFMAQPVQEPPGTPTPSFPSTEEQSGVNPDYSKTLEGIILFNHPNNAYWPEGSEYDDNSTPLCSSVDGKLALICSLKLSAYFLTCVSSSPEKSASRRKVATL